MTDIQQYKNAARFAKFVLPRTSFLLSSQRAQTFVSLGETAAAMLQGKGTGSGWDLHAETIAALRFIEPGATVFDIGANKGDWSRFICARLSGNVKLFLFEPQEGCHAELETLGVLIKSAVGEQDGEATLYSPGGIAGNASLYIRKDTYFQNTNFAPSKVHEISIDSFMASRAIKSVDFIKMDIEGHELSALKGARRALAAGTIKALSFEFGSGNLNSRTYFRDFWDVLTDYGYSISRVLSGGRLLKIERYSEELEYFRGVSNYIAAAG